MNRLPVLAVFLLALPAQAATEPRCGSDAFGNRVCIDKDGVLREAPRDAADRKDVEQAGTEAADEKGEGKQARPRCGVDPFGNTVCLK